MASETLAKPNNPDDYADAIEWAEFWLLRELTIRVTLGHTPGYLGNEARQAAWFSRLALVRLIGHP